MTAVESIEDIADMRIRIEELPEIVSPRLAAAFFQCHRTTLWRWEKKISEFPKAKRFSRRKSGYLLSEIRAYLKSI